MLSRTFFQIKFLLTKNLTKMDLQLGEKMFTYYPKNTLTITNIKGGKT